MADYFDSGSDDSDRWDCDDYATKRTVVSEPRTAEVTTFKTKLVEWRDLLDQRYKECITVKGQQMLKQDIRACFHDCSCKHQMALYLAENCHSQSPLVLGRSRIRSLPCFIFEVLKCQPDITIHEKFDSFIMKRAWKLASHNATTMISLVTDCFQLSVEQCPWIIDELQVMLNEEMYREVFYCIKTLRIKDITIDMIACPLICNDNTNLLETYITGNTGLQTELIKLLDRMIVSEEAIENTIRNIPNTILSEIGIKKILKLALRYMKKYLIPNELCSNILTAKYESTIRYHLHMYYDTKENSLEEFNDGLESILNEMPSCGDYLVDLIIGYLDMDLAAFWAHKLQLEYIPNQIENRVALLKSNDKASVQPKSSNNIASNEIFYQFPLPLDCIHWIDESNDFERCVTRLSQPHTKVGIDCEWKPNFTVGHASRISIMQLAINEECVFLLDMITLKKILKESQWIRLANEFFCNSQVLKIGFGLNGDIQMIIESLPFLNTSLSSICTVANLDKTCNEVIIHDQEKAGDKKRERKKGLKGVIEYCLGKPLNKKQQMTNWELRPLDVKQAIYAALDAYCLIALFDYIKAYVEREKMDLSLVTNEYSCKLSKQKKKTAKIQAKSNKFYPIDNRANIHKISAKSVKFVVDNMLQGLGKQLRSCGIDTVIIGSNQSHDCIGQIATSQDRFILTSGEPYSRLSSQVPEGHCLDVPTSKAHQQLDAIISHFNINVTAKDVFSRCQNCNTNTFLQVSQNEMLDACEKLSRKIKNKSKYNNTNKGTIDDPDLSQMKSRCIHTRVSMSQEGLIACKNLKVDVSQIPLKVAENIREFYVCSCCAKIYWDGAQYTRACGNMLK